MLCAKFDKPFLLSVSGSSGHFVKLCVIWWISRLFVINIHQKAMWTVLLCCWVCSWVNASVLRPNTHTHKHTHTHTHAHYESVDCNELTADNWTHLVAPATNSVLCGCIATNGCVNKWSLLTCKFLRCVWFSVSEWVSAGGDVAVVVTVVHSNTLPWEQQWSRHRLCCV